jgi:hypothetical protein
MLTTREALTLLFLLLLFLLFLVLLSWGIAKMPSLVTFARSLALTFAHLTPAERSAKIQDYLLVGVPGRGAVPMHDEAALVLRNYERLQAGALGAALLCREPLSRSTEERQTKAARTKRRALLRWKRSRKAGA